MTVRVAAPRFIVASLLFFVVLTAGATGAISEQALSGSFVAPDPEQGVFVLRAEEGGGLACRPATPEESYRINRPREVPLRVFGEDGVGLQAGLNIILRGTAQLDANPAAKAAFERAAAIWESKISDTITIYVDVDYGTTRFGEAFEEDTIASAGTPSYIYNPGSFATLRASLIARANNASESTIYGLLPASSVPTDDVSGSTSRFGAGAPLLRVLGFFDAVALPDDPAPSIGFNSKFSYDFDPSNGIFPGQTDFEGVVVHEIGHMLGFVSRVGSGEQGNTVGPAVLDLFRFRPGVTLGSFTSAQRILSSGGEQVFFAGGTALGLSTGRSDGTGGDERQASHWKDDALSGVRIGIMDPTLASGVRSELTNADLTTFGFLGYAIGSSGTPPNTPAAPSNLSATATSATTVALSWVDNATNENEFRVEVKSGGGAFADLGSIAANATGANVTALNPSTTYTFRVRARNGSGNSAYSNEASATTPATSGGVCTPNATTVCLLNNRFRVTINYVNPFSNPPNQPGTFQAARLDTTAGINPDVALFGFSSAQAVEVVVRLQDTRPFANRFDLYYGGMTDVAYTVLVTDTVTGTTRQYVNPVGTVGGGLDRSSFPASLAGSDRLLTSGGTDSFFDDSLNASLLRRTSLGRRKTAPSAGSSLRLANTTPAPALKPVGGFRLSGGGGGGCSEIEPNETILLADLLTLGVPCTGTAGVNDAFSYTIEYEDGVDPGKVQDVFEFTTAASAPATVALTFTNASADLDLVLFKQVGDSLTIVEVAASTTGTSENIALTSLPAGTYYVGVSAYEGSSSYTLTVSSSGVLSAPAAPSNLTASATSSTVIRLNWQDNSNNENEFRIEQKSGVSFVDLGSATANSTQINITGLSAGQTATFRVRARNGSGDSPYSNEASATTPAGPGPCVANSTTVCLLSNRFRVSIAYVNPFSNPPNQPGTFLAARLLQGTQNPDTALFGFNSAQAVEVLVRVQDTRPFAPRFDVYYGGMTDVGYTVTVTDTQTGTTRQYVNPIGKVGGGVDRTSFPAN